MSAGIRYGVPRLPTDLVSRPRIWQELQSGGGLTVLWAPHGSGKTVAVADWIRHGLPPQASAAWVDVDGVCRDRSTFWATVIDLLCDAGLLAGADGLRHRATAPLDDSHVVGSRRALIRGLRRVQGPLVVVLDGITVHDTDVWHDIVTVAAAVPQLQIVACVAATQGLTQSGRMLLRDHAQTSITGASLAFTRGETSALLVAHAVPAPEAYLDGVHQLTQGCVSATARAVRELGLCDVPPDPADLARHVLLDEPWRDLVASLPDVERHLARLAWAYSPTRELAISITELECPDPYLQLAECAGMGMWSLHDREPRFEFTARVGGQLRARGLERWPDDATASLRRVTEWSLERDLILDALRGAVALGELDLVARLVRANLGRFMLARPAAFHDILALAAKQHAAVPALAPLLHALYAVHATLRPRVIDVLSTSDRIADNLEENPALTPGRIGISLLSRRIWGKPAALDAATLIPPASPSKAPSAVPSSAHAVRVGRHRSFRSPEPDCEARYELLLEAGLAQLAHGEHAEALTLFRSARTIVEPSQHPRMLRALGYTAAARADAGELAGIDRTLHCLQNAAWPAEWVDGPPGIPFRAARAWHRLDAGDPGAAREDLLAAAAAADTFEFWTFLAAPLATLAFLTMDFTSAEKALFAADREVDWMQAPLAWQSRRFEVQSLLYLAHGRFQHAFESRHWSLTTPGRYLSVARAALFAGDSDAAASALDTADRIGMRTVREQADNAALRACLTMQSGDSPTLHSMLGKLSALLTSHRLRLPLLLLPPGDLDSIREASPELGVLLDSGCGQPSRVHPAQRFRLSAREAQILEQLAAGRKLTQIARANVVSLNTIKTQVRSLYRKLDVSGRYEAVERARSHGLIETVVDEEPFSR